MSRNLFLRILATSILLTLSFESAVLAQKSKIDATARAPSPGELSFVDAARSGLAGKEVLRCGAASGNPGWSADGTTVRADLSFGLIPASPERLGANARYIGSWAVRNVLGGGAAGPESVASIYFDGFLTSGSISDLKGGARGYDVFGAANFTGSLCDARANYETRHYARFTGACGLGQNITFELSSRPPVNEGFGAFFREEDLYAKGVFTGDVACGTTGDARRVRTDLSRRR